MGSGAVKYGGVIKSNQIKIFISPAAIEAQYISVTGFVFYT
jgi:hypothetical protein